MVCLHFCTFTAVHTVKCALEISFVMMTFFLRSHGQYAIYERITGKMACSSRRTFFNNILRAFWSVFSFRNTCHMESSYAMGFTCKISVEKCWSDRSIVDVDDKIDTERCDLHKSVLNMRASHGNVSDSANTYPQCNLYLCRVQRAQCTHSFAAIIKLNLWIRAKAIKTMKTGQTSQTRAYFLRFARTRQANSNTQNRTIILTYVHYYYRQLFCLSD